MTPRPTRSTRTDPPFPYPTLCRSPEYWKPEDSALVFALLNFGLAVNLQEEIASLTLAQKVGSDKLAWLTPTYPDEHLPFDERSEEHTSALQSLMRISYAGFGLKKKKKK